MTDGAYDEPGPGRLGELRRVLEDVGRVVVAFSGGVDSALVARAANDVLGPDRCLAVTATSASLPESERDECRRMAEAWGLRWREADTAELERPAYAANGRDRCYHCKAELMDVLAPIAAGEGAAVALGVNLDDLDDHRPGQLAAAERGAVFPLVLAGFTKAGVRRAAWALGMDVWDKPAGACLASRLPYGTPVTVERLGAVAAAEESLRALGFRQVRVRHYGHLARVEVEAAKLPEVLGQRDAVVAAVKSAGYRYVTLDLEGFRSGNLNQ